MVMNKKYPWLPLDERLVPDIFSFKYPKSPWVRVALAVEMFCAVVAVVGTLLLALLVPYTSTSPTATKAASTQAPVIPQPK